MATPPVPHKELKKDVDAYMATGGNRSEAARLRGMPRKSYTKRLEIAQRELGVQLGKVVDGRVDAVEAIKRPLPKGKGVARYILTSAQNNTHTHPGLRSLLTYAGWLDGINAASSCEFIVGTFSYAIDAYGAKAVKRGAYKPSGDLWYAPELVPYIRDESIQLAPGLIWCGEQNILPTATNPLTRMETYNGRNSNIVPHVRLAMESVASLPDEATKFNYATGAVTLRNYIQKRAGILAEQAHCYGAVLVEVDSAGNWYVRQLEIGAKGEVYDIGPDGYRGVKIINGEVQAIKCGSKSAETFVDSISWGDIHASEMDEWVRHLGWGRGGFLDTTRAKRQFWHDLFSMRSRGHHEIDDEFRSYEKFVDGEDSVEGELQVTADFAHDAVRPWCETFVVRSNHCRHLDRFLNEGRRIKHDPQNAAIFYRLKAAKIEAIRRGDRDFNILEFALRGLEHPIPEAVRFLGEDDSFVICKEFDGGIECALHGDLGVNGARGSTQGLRKLARRVNKEHDHMATWRDGVLSGGACALRFPYQKGPSASSISHILNFENSARQIITFWNGKFRA